MLPETGGHHRQLLVKAEWHPVWASVSLAAVFGASLLVAAYAWKRRGRWQAPGRLSVTVFAIAALLHIRHLSIYAVVWTVFVPAWVEVTPMGKAIRSFWKGNRRPVMAASLVVILLGPGASPAFEWESSPDIPWKGRLSGRPA